MIYSFGGESIRGMVHAFAPGPEGIALGGAAMLGASADYALEGMRMHIDEAGENGAAWQALDVHQTRRVAGDASDLTNCVGDQRYTALETSVGVGQVG